MWTLGVLASSSQPAPSGPFFVSDFDFNFSNLIILSYFIGADGVLADTSPIQSSLNVNDSFNTQVFNGNNDLLASTNYYLVDLKNVYTGGFQIYCNYTTGDTGFWENMGNSPAPLGRIEMTKI